jgi:hypothetical protein
VQARRRTLGPLTVDARRLSFESQNNRYEPTTVHCSALELGVFFLDTADTYADGANERLVGHALTSRRDQVCLATNFGFVFPDGGGHLNGRPEYVKVACEASLRRLGTDHIDLYYLHRVDPEVPVEETVGAMARLVAEGKALHLGLWPWCAPSPATHLTGSLAAADAGLDRPARPRRRGSRDRPGPDPLRGSRAQPGPAHRHRPPATRGRHTSPSVGAGDQGG